MRIIIIADSSRSPQVDAMPAIVAIDLNLQANAKRRHRSSLRLRFRDIGLHNIPTTRYNVAPNRSAKTNRAFPRKPPDAIPWRASPPRELTDSVSGPRPSHRKSGCSPPRRSRRGHTTPLKTPNRSALQTCDRRSVARSPLADRSKDKNIPPKLMHEVNQVVPPMPRVTPIAEGSRMRRLRSPASISSDASEHAAPDAAGSVIAAK